MIKNHSNKKAAKRARSLMPNWKDTNYMLANAAKPRKVDGQFDINGFPIFFTPTGTIELTPECGRYRYKVAKRAAAAA